MKNYDSLKNVFWISHSTKVIIGFHVKTSWNENYWFHSKAEVSFISYCKRYFVEYNFRDHTLKVILLLFSVFLHYFIALSEIIVRVFWILFFIEKRQHWRSFTSPSRLSRHILRWPLLTLTFIPLDLTKNNSLRNYSTPK